MKSNGTKICKQLRGKRRVGFFEQIRQRLEDRVMEHVAHCPRCQNRLISLRKVEYGLVLIRSQVQQIDLLKRANEQALGVLKHSLRDSRAAEKLRHIEEQPNVFVKNQSFFERIVSFAACILVLIIIKTGLVHSMNTIHDQGALVMRNYYTKNLDAELYKEIFDEQEKIGIRT